MLTLLVDIGGVLVINHIIQVRNFAIGISDDGELQVRSGNLVDVLDPVIVGFKGVGALRGKKKFRVSHACFLPTQIVGRAHLPIQ